ncbi:MAG: DUF4968 domain-containing protein, partial [Candidatus Symbiothrix sp.]|nr:DUF4968 domain-containing protein [Candidatus Symbiothrix sp.]
MKKFIALFLFLCTTIGYAQGESFHRDANTIQVSASGENLQIEFCSPDMFRIRRSPNNVYAENEQWMIRKYDFSPVDLKTETQTDAYSIATADLKIRIAKHNLLIEVQDKTGKTLYSEQANPHFYPDSVSNQVTLGADEHFFGFGERMDFLDQRGKQVYLNVELGRGTKPAVGGKDILRANYCPVPLMISTRGYGVFFHTAFPTRWDMGWSSKDNYTFGANGGELDYYFIYGPDMYAIVDNYTQLTGKSPMLPRYAMGLHVGTY